MLTQPHIPRLAAIILAAAQFFVGAAIACKDRHYPARFPLDKLAIYEHVYVVRVEKVELARPLEDSWYGPPFTFEGQIVRSLKGSMYAGDAIRATTSTDEPAARCPILLRAGETYLLMLNGSTSPYVLPRFGSLFVASDNKLFESYVQTIANAGRQAVVH
jgi:hypothetical protein